MNRLARLRKRLVFICWMSFSETKPLSILDFSEELPVLFFAESLWTNTLDLRPKLYKKIF